MTSGAVEKFGQLDLDGVPHEPSSRHLNAKLRIRSARPGEIKRDFSEWLPHKYRLAVFAHLRIFTERRALAFSLSEVATRTECSSQQPSEHELLNLNFVIRICAPQEVGLP